MVRLHVSFERHPISICGVVSQSVQANIAGNIGGEDEQLVELGVCNDDLLPPVAQNVSYEHGIDSKTDSAVRTNTVKSWQT